LQHNASNTLEGCTALFYLCVLLPLCRPPRQYQPMQECLGWVLLQQGKLKQAEQVRTTCIVLSTASACLGGTIPEP
jgi:hypothetical protein